MSGEEKMWALSKPAIMEDAVKANKGYNFIVEIIKFMLVYLITDVGLMMLLSMLVGAVIKSDPGATVTIIISCSIIALVGVACFPIYRYIEKTKIRNMGLVKKGAVKEYLLGALCGFLCFGTVIVLSIVTGAAKFEGVTLTASTFPLILLVFPFFLLQSAGEEFTYRGYFLSTFSRRHNLWLSAVLCGVWFAIAHAGNAGIESPFAVINLILVGTMLSVSVIKRGNIWFACGLHGLWNFSQGNIFGLPVSGNDAGASILKFSLAEDKSTLLTGGTFALEASVTSSVVLFIMLIVVLMWKAEDYGKL